MFNCETRSIFGNWTTQENNNDRLRRQYGLNLNYHPQNDHVRKINPKKNKPMKKTLENTSDKEKNVSYNQKSVCKHQCQWI